MKMRSNIPGRTAAVFGENSNASGAQRSHGPKRKARKAGGVALLLGLALSSPARADSTTTANLAPGILYQHSTYTSLFGSPQDIYILDLNLNVPGVDIQISGNSGTLQTVATQGAAVAHSVAAVNGNLFSGTSMIEYVKRGGVSISPASTDAGNATMGALVRNPFGALSIVPRGSTDWPTTVAGDADALASHPCLVAGGVNNSFDPNDPFVTQRNPRTFASWNANNHIVIFCADGRLSNAAGMTCAEEQSYVHTYATATGTTVESAENFDGGGSTTMWRTGVGVVNQPSDGVARAVVDAIVVTYTTPPPTPAIADYSGDGKADYPIFRPSDGTWHIDKSDGSGYAGFQFGQSGDIPLSGDFGSDQITDAVLFRPGTATWYIRLSETGAYYSFSFGQGTDIPLVGGDFSHDNVDDVVLFRPSTGVWYVRFSQDGGIHSFQFGQNGDIPLLGGDFDADGSPDAVLFRPGTATWYVRSSITGTFHSFSFGQSTDIPLLGGDYSGDGIPDPIVFRPSTGMWYVRFSQDASVHSFQFGQSGDIPFAGRNVSGSSVNDYVLYRPSTGRWYVRRSDNGAISSVVYGLSTDIPVP